MTTFPTDYLAYLQALEEKNVFLSETEKAILEKENGGKKPKPTKNQCGNNRGDLIG